MSDSMQATHEYVAKRMGALFTQRVKLVSPKLTLSMWQIALSDLPELRKRMKALDTYVYIRREMFIPDGKIILEGHDQFTMTIKCYELGEARKRAIDEVIQTAKDCGAWQ